MITENGKKCEIPENINYNLSFFFCEGFLYLP